MRILRQVHEHPAREADLRRQARALGADRVLDDLHQHRVALVDHPLDRRRLFLRELAVLPDVRHVQERRALEPDVDERRLHAGQHARDPPEVDVAHQPAHRAALDVQFLHDAGKQHRHPRFLGRDVDEDVFHLLASVRRGHARHGSEAVLAIARDCRRGRERARRGGARPAKPAQAVPGLPCAAHPRVAPRNSLCALRARRSDSRGESEVEARCARRREGCAARRLRRPRAAPPGTLACSVAGRHVVASRLRRALS